MNTDGRRVGLGSVFIGVHLWFDGSLGITRDGIRALLIVRFYLRWLAGLTYPDVVNIRKFWAHNN